MVTRDRGTIQSNSLISERRQQWLFNKQKGMGSAGIGHRQID